MFLEEARRTLAQAKQAVQAAQRAHRGEVGRLVVGFVASATFNIFPEIVQTFRSRFPDVLLVLQEMTTVQQVEALHEASVQFGFLYRPVNDAALVLETILREPLVVAMPANHPLAARRRIPLKVLAQEPFILTPRHLVPGLYDLIMRVCERAGFSPQVTQEATQMHTIVGLVAAGIGISLVPDSVQNLRRPGVVFRALQGEAPRVELAVAWRRDHALPVVQAFLSVAQEIGARQAL